MVAWMLLLMAGISLSGDPLLGSFGATARDTLARLTVRPGMALFKNSVGEDKVEAHCTSVTAVTADGRRDSLYAPECPRSHFLWRTDPQDQLMQRIAQNTLTRDLRGEPVVLTAESAFHARRFAALADYYCHSRSDADAHSDYAKVEIRHHRLTRNIQTGEMVDRPHVLCRFACRANEVRAPRCELETDPGAAPEADREANPEGMERP